MKHLNFILLFCIAFYTSVFAQNNIRPTLCHIAFSTDNFSDTPYRLSIKGDIVGELPKFKTYELISFEGQWAKVRYMSTECYIARNRVETVDKPEFVCSPWVRNWFSYKYPYIGLVGEWEGVADDWTKPLTREEAAEIIVNDFFGRIYSAWEMKHVLKPAVKTGGNRLITDSNGGNEHKLAVWGIVPPGKFNPKGKITYQEITSWFIKLISYNIKYMREGAGKALTKEDFAKFGIGGDTKLNALCTKEQLMVLCDKVFLWYSDQEFKKQSNYKIEDCQDGCNIVNTGVYYIKTYLGNKPNQPYLIVNNRGTVELSNSKKQKYKITFIKHSLNYDSNLMKIYTIQTMDGKYVGIPGITVSGKNATIQNNEFLWEISSGISEDYQFTNTITDPNNIHQVLNASGWNLSDNTPIISWYWNLGTGTDNNNCKFIFVKLE